MEWTIRVEQIDPENDILGSEIPANHLGERVAVSGDDDRGVERFLKWRRDYIMRDCLVMYVVPKGGDTEPD